MTASNYLRFYTSSFTYVPREIFHVTLITGSCKCFSKKCVVGKNDEMCATETLLKLPPSGLRYVSIPTT